MLQLRSRVFVVEQRCAYLDLDGIDAACHHLYVERDGAVLAYLRVVPPGVKYTEPSLGRVVTAPEVRRAGLDPALVAEGLLARGEWPSAAARAL